MQETRPLRLRLHLRLRPPRQDRPRLYAPHQQAAAVVVAAAAQHRPQRQHLRPQGRPQRLLPLHRQKRPVVAILVAIIRAGR